MRLPRIRLTTRQMMVAVAAGSALALWIRSVEYKRMGWLYRRIGAVGSRCGGDGRLYYALADQCQRAASYPWLSVDPKPRLPDRVPITIPIHVDLPPLPSTE